MTIIREESFFSIQELYDMAPTQKYAAIIAGIDLDMIYHAVRKPSRYGAPESVNRPATITAYLIRFVERIPTVKDLARRLKNDIAFRMDCGFRVDDTVPYEATFSRLTTKLSDTNILEQAQASVIVKRLTKGLSQMIRWLLTRHMWKREIRHPLRKWPSRSRHLRNAGVNQ